MSKKGLTITLTKPQEDKFETVGDVRRFLQDKGVSSRDFLVNPAGVLSGQTCTWEVIIINASAISAIKDLIKGMDVSYRVFGDIGNIDASLN